MPLYEDPKGKVVCLSCKSDDVDILESANRLGLTSGRTVSNVVDSICRVKCLACGNESKESYRDYFHVDEEPQQRKICLASKIIRERASRWFNKPRFRGALLN